MELRHRFRLPVPVDRVWPVVSRLDRLAPSFPGATVDAVGADQLSGSLNVKLGAVALLYRGTGTYLERSPGRHRVVVQASGDDARGLGSAAAVVTVQLTGRGSETEVEVVTELELTGKPARYGAGVVADVSDRLLDQFASSLAERFTDPEFGTGATEELPTGTDPAADDAPTGRAGLTATRLWPPPESSPPLAPPLRRRDSAPRRPVEPPGAERDRRRARTTLRPPGRRTGRAAGAGRPAPAAGEAPVLSGRRGAGQSMMRSRTVSARPPSLSSRASSNRPLMSVTT